MLNFNIRNFGQIAAAELDIDPACITIVAGRNAAGKSTVLRALANLLTGNAKPFEAPNKADLPALVTDGASTATIALSAPDSGAEISIAWPKGELRSRGAPPRLSEVAAGTNMHPLDLDVSSRAKALAALIGAEPTFDEFAAALKGVDHGAINGAWRDVEALGWDGAMKQAEKAGQTEKGQWKQATGGETWGENKGGAWTPPNWHQALAETPVATLEVETLRRRAVLEDAIRAGGAGAADRQRLESAAADYDSAHAAMVDAATRVNAAKEAYDVAARHKASLPPATDDAGVACPHCGGAVIVRGGGLLGPASLEKADSGALDDASLKKRRLDMASADGSMSKAKADVAAAERVQVDAVSRFQAANLAKAKLAELATAPGGGLMSDEEAARVALMAAEQSLVAKRQHAAAAAIHASIMAIEAIKRALKPEGLRRVVMARALDDFNAAMRRLTDAAGWPAVTLDADMAFQVGGRPYRLLGGLGGGVSSLQFRARVVIQAEIARRCRDDMVLIDAADILDAKGRAGLVKLLRAAGLGAVIGMTYADPVTAAKLGPYTQGRVWWLDAGKASLIYDPAAMAAAAE